MKHNLYGKFKRIFDKDAETAYFSPGRVNLIGEHIDYNGGLVMPCAVTLGTYLLVAPNNEGIFRFKSVNFKETAEIAVGSTNAKKEELWFNYPTGVIEHFNKDGK